MSPAPAGPSHDAGPLVNGTSYAYTARVEDAADNLGAASNTYDITIDTTAPTAAVDITAITDDTGTAGDFKTSDTVLMVSGTNGALGAGEKVQVSNDGGATWFDVTPDAGTTWHYDDPDTHAGNFTYLARVVDAADNVGDTDTQDVIVNQPPVANNDADTVAEGAAEITVNVLANDTDPDSILTFSEHHRLYPGHQRYRRLQQQRHLHLHPQRFGDDQRQLHLHDHRRCR